MKHEKTTFALFFGNRGFFPSSLIQGARRELVHTLKKLGHQTLIMEARSTRYDAVETAEEGKVYARFLEQNRGKFGGVILCLPNFGDETGAVAALKNAGVPILVQAYPDELDKLSMDCRRDAFCGKLSIMDVFCQYGVKFSALKPHVVHPKSGQFAENIDTFDRLCRVVNGLRETTVGAIGARTTPFKTVRCDELTLQKHGITVETFDLSDLFMRMDQLGPSSKEVREKAATLRTYSNWKDVPNKAFNNLVSLSVVLDQITREANLDALAIRCWLEIQQRYGISPCILLSELNDRGIPAACEVDIGSAVTMVALSKATGKPSTCLDWNNNFADDENKCILFHCGPVPQSLMSAKGTVVDHEILINTLGPGCSYGPNVGRIAPMDFTYGNMLTRDGKMHFYLGEARITEDNVPRDFFGCAGVAQFADLQTVLHTIGQEGHRHHVSLAPGKVMAPLLEAFTKYLGYEVTVL